MYIFYSYFEFHFTVYDEICMHMKAQTLNKLLVLKLSLDSNFVAFETVSGFVSSDTCMFQGLLILYHPQ